MTLPSEWTRGSAAQLAYGQLRERIVNLELLPGTLLDDAALGQCASVSRTAVREALVKLSLDGLVECPPHRPASVSRIDYSSVEALLHALELMLRSTSHLAAQNRHDKDLQLARRSADALDFARDAENDAEAFAGLVELHMSIARVGRNSYLSTTLNRLFGDVGRMLRAHGLLTGRFPKIDVGSQKDTLLRAIWQRNPSLAAECGRQNASAIKNTIQQHVIPPRLPDIEIADLKTVVFRGTHCRQAAQGRTI